MTTAGNTWPQESFGAIGIRARQAKITIRGTDGDEVRLEDNEAKKQLGSLLVNQTGNWLWVSDSAKRRSIDISLLLPKAKPWLLDVYGRNVEFLARDIRGRLNVVSARGEVKAIDCRGVITVASGRADVNLQRFATAEMPEMPPLPVNEDGKDQDRFNRYITLGKEELAQWGLDLGEKVVKGLLGQKAIIGQQIIDIKLGRGDLHLEDVEASSCVVRSARSNVRLKGLRVSNLDLVILRGDVQGEAAAPGEHWRIRTHNGNISLRLPPKIGARLDAATRRGDIKTDIPLVRVARQGPEPRHGGRMVGTIGAAPEKKGKIPEIRLSTLQGDINIATGDTAVPPGPPRPPVSPKAGAVTDADKKRLAVLEALRQGQVSVDEAGMILDALENEGKDA